MENERTIPEYLNTLNKSCPDKKHTKKKESGKIDITEINKLFDSLTKSIQKLDDSIDKEYSKYNKAYLEGSVKTLEFVRDQVANIIQNHLK